MSFATSTAIALGVGAASAGASVYGAKKSADASKGAAKTQSAAADKAMAAQQAGYQQQRADFDPYRQAGVAALGRLGATAGTYTGGMPQQGPPQGQPMQMGQLGMRPPGGPMPGQGVPQMQAQMGMGGPQGGGMAQGGMVRVIAPTGEVAMLPAAQAQLAVQRGARIDNSGGGGMPGGPMQRGMV